MIAAAAIIAGATAAQADVLGALTACQVERQDFTTLPSVLRLQGWQSITPPLSAEQQNRLNFTSLVNVPNTVTLTPDAPLADWQMVWTDATNWSNQQSLAFLAAEPRYAALLQDGAGNLLFLRAGETVDGFAISCALAVTQTGAAAPDFLPELTPNDSPASVRSIVDRPDNRLTRTTRVIMELAIRPGDFTAVLGIPADVAAVFYTSVTFPKEQG